MSDERKRTHWEPEIIQLTAPDRKRTGSPAVLVLFSAGLMVGVILSAIIRWVI